jgi:hypothetical protein
MLIRNPCLQSSVAVCQYPNYALYNRDRFAPVHALNVES